MKLELVSKNQIEKIHLNSLKILERIGVKVPHDLVLSMFKEVGASVDMEKKLVISYQSSVNINQQVNSKLLL